MPARILPVRNPRTGDVDYQLHCTAPEALRDIAASLRQSQPRWSALGVHGRSEVLDQWATQLIALKRPLLDALVTDTGRYRLSLAEVEGLPHKIRRWAKVAPEILRTRSHPAAMSPQVTLDRQYVPYTLAGFISPWNFPLSLSFIDALPALIAGCCAIVKPSEVTPRFIEPLRESFANIPELADALAVVAGDGATGNALVNLVDMVCFTGSVPTGRKVAETAAARFIPAFLELGGKDPAIVLQSASLSVATDAILRQGMVNAGQVCLSLERVYVAEAIHDQFVQLLVSKASALEINHPDIHKGHIGPLIFQKQADIIRDHLADALERGATIACGGSIIRRDGGLWCEPTVLTNATHEMRIMREETFGPILPVMSFSSTEEAIRLANDSDFGLSAAVFSGDIAEARAVAERLEAGGVSINDAGLQSVTTEAEKQSFKFSGLGGSRMGNEGLLRFLRRKALMIQTGTPRSMDAFDEADSSIA
ncbi:MAG: aldehyde dehydrogenase family protein [Gammaproteobacteria bacterium]|nr:aldehyde dehydrogenase family protein [Gammaproteobacteria bacterium]